MTPSEPLSFKSPAELNRWLKANHAKKPELWIRIFKKNSGQPSVDWNDCVVAAITWGWIDGQRKALDEASFLQRLTPRRANSNWSKKNCVHAERLIAEGSMRPAGMAHVEAARKNGRWEKAYAGSAEMAIPVDFLVELKKNKAAAKFYTTLDRRNLFVIYHRIESASRPETRKIRIQRLLDTLARSETFH